MAVVVILPLHHEIDGIIAHLEESMKLPPNLELVLNIVIVPSLLNMCFVWVMDNLIMNPSKTRSNTASIVSTAGSPNTASMLSAAEGGGLTPTFC